MLTVSTTSSNNTQPLHDATTAINSSDKPAPVPDSGRHDNISDAEACDWPLNVTWILEHYNNVSRFGDLQFICMLSDLVVA